MHNNLEINLSETIVLMMGFNFGREVWDTASRLFERVCILSSAGTIDPTKGEVVRQGKIQWLKKTHSFIIRRNDFYSWWEAS